MSSIEEITMNGILKSQIVVPIIDDGACRFRPISFHLFNTQERCQEIRNTIVAYVSDNWNTFYKLLQFIMVITFLLLSIMLVEWAILLSTVVTSITVFETYYNNNLHAKFGVDTFPVKRLCLTRNINSGNFDVYLSISNILNVTENDL